MYAVQTVNPRERWETVRKFWDWSDARTHAFYLRLDGYDVRIIEVQS
jgi:hypothetical protein